MKNIFLAVIFFSVTGNSYDVGQVQVGCGAETSVTGQALLFREANVVYALTSDLSVAGAACVQVMHAGKLVPLNFVESNARAGLALFEAPVTSIKDKYSELLDSAVPRRLKIIRSSGERTVEIEAKTLQIKSSRSFFSRGTSTIEIQAEGLRTQDQGAVVLDETNKIVGLISRYQLKFQVGLSTWVEKFPALLDQPVVSPVVYPIDSVLKWVRQTLAETKARPIFRVQKYEGKKMTVRVGNLLFEEDCTYARAGRHNLSPIGGFDGYGVGGFDGYGVGGLEVFVLGGYGVPATACELTVEILDKLNLRSNLFSDIEQKYATGDRLVILGHERLNPETGDLVLIPILSLDHFFKHKEVSGTRPLFGWNGPSINQQPTEYAAVSWAKEMGYIFNPTHELNKPTEPAQIYYLNLVRLTTLTMMSTEPELTNYPQWKRILERANLEREKFGLYGSASFALGTNKNKLKELDQEITKVLAPFQNPGIGK